MAEKQQIGNQQEQEFFAVVGTGRKGVEKMLEVMGEEIKAVAAPNVRGDWDTWITRVFVDIANREELQPVLSSKQGIYSLYQEIAKAATAGFQLGGIVPHGYFVPKQGKATFVDTMEGRAFVATRGPGAVLEREGQLVRFYEGDKLSIDAVNGTVQHTYDLLKDRGKHMGWYMVLEYLDGHKEVPYITVDKVRKINEAYSTKQTSSGKMMPAWAKSPEEMEDKTAGKQLYKKPFREAVGNAMFRTLEPEDAELEHVQPVMRTVSERVNDRLNKVVEAQPPAQEQEKQAEKPPAPPPEAEKEAGVPGPQDLF